MDNPIENSSHEDESEDALTPKGSFSVLLVEDDPEDARRFESCLKESTLEAEFRRKEDLQAVLKALREARPDVLVVDLGLTESEGTPAVKVLAAAAPEVPVVVLVESGNLETALEAQRAGASERLQKGELSPALVERTVQLATQRRRMQAKLRQRDAWIRSVTEGLSTGVFRAGPTGRIEYANQSLAEMLGFEREEELIGRDLTTFYADPTRRGQMLAEEGAEGAEVELNREDGSTFVGLLSAKAAYDASGKAIHYDGTITDITERVRRKRKLRVLSEAIEQAKESVLITEAEPLGEPGPKVAYVNSAFEEMTGWAEEEIVGKTPRVLQGPETEREGLGSLRSALEAGEEWEGETVNYRKDGEPYRVQLNLAPVSGEDGDVEYWVSVQRDVTEKREREEELRRQKALLEQAQRLAGAWEVDLQDNELLWTEEVYHIHELPPDADIDVETAIDFYAPEARPRLRAAYERCVEEGEPYDLEVPILTAEGNRRWIRTTGAPVEEEEGKVLKVAGAVQDITKRKKRERELREKERRYRAVFEDPNILAGLLEKEGAVLDVNRTAMAYVDASVEELRGDPFWETPWFEGNEALQGEVREWIRRAGAGEYVEFEADVSQSVGQPLVASGVVRPVTDEKGEVSCLFISARDVTERNRRRQRLARYQEYTGRLLDATEDLFFVFDAEGTLQRWNEQVATVTGYSEEELGGMSALALVPERDREQTQAAIAEVFEKGRSQLETRLLTKEGSTIPYELTGNRVEHPDGDLRLVSIGRDITERKRRERVLQERREKVEALYEATGRLLAAESPRAVSRHVHEVVEDVFDYALSNTGFVEEGLIEPVDVSVEGSVEGPENEPQPIGGGSVVARALRAGETVVVQNTSALDNRIDYGDLRSVAAVPIGGRGVIVLGQAEGRQFDSFDLRLIEVLASSGAAVLDRLENEKELVEAKKKAEEASRLKSSMLANMSHEVRTPLTSITGFAEILTEELEGRLREFASRIYGSSQRLMKTLDSVLELSKLEARAQTLDREEVDLGFLAEETVEMLRPEAEDKSLTLETDLPETRVEGLWNEGALSRIMENLLENAIKFTPEGGRVEVRVQEEEGEATLEVEDTGIGIGEEARETIFEAFKQESEGLSREYEGSGLGLSIVKQLAEELGGTIDVKTEKGEGTCFTVRLPRSEGPDKEAGGP